MSPRPLAPWPFRRNRVPSSVPGGIVIVRCFWARTSPEPWHVGQRCAGTLPRPRHTGHGRCTAKPPCPNEIVPRPLHSGHVEKVVPGAPPEPLLVVLLPHLRVAQDVVRLVDVLEAVGGLRIIGITIGVVLLGEAAKRFLDLVGRRRLGHSEDLVIVSLRSHLLPVPAPPCFTS